MVEVENQGGQMGGRIRRGRRYIGSTTYVSKIYLIPLNEQLLYIYI